VWSVPALRVLNVVHRGLVRVSFGKLGWSAGKMPVVELTTTGRRTGKRRSVMLTSPLQIDDDVIVVASRGGDEHHPHWFLNLRDDPDVEVDWKGSGVCPWRARVADAGERAEMWPLVVERYAPYAEYQTRSGREIPLVVLSPR
jgi:deazaflavin-dependent oxidoreductase (nitroreductase family)